MCYSKLWTTETHRCPRCHHRKGTFLGILWLLPMWNLCGMCLLEIAGAIASASARRRAFDSDRSSVRWVGSLAPSDLNKGGQL